MNPRTPLPAGQQVLRIFGALSAILMMVGGLLFFSLRSIERSNQLQQSRALDKLALIDDLAQDVGQMQAGVLRQILASALEEIQRLDQSVRALEKTNANELVTYQKFVATEQEKQLYDRIVRARKTYWEQTQPALAFGLSNWDAEATAVVNSTQASAYDDYLRAINALTEYVDEDVAETTRATTRLISQVRIIGNSLVGLAVVISVGAGFAVARIARRLKADNTILQSEIKERQLAEGELRWKTAFLEALMNASIDGILVVDDAGKKLFQNQRMTGLLKIPPAIAEDQDDKKQLEWVTGMTKDPARFFEKVSHLNAHPDEISRDEMELKNGTVLDRYSSPVFDKNRTYYGRIWTFRDITGRKQTEESLRLLGSAVEQSKESIVITDAALDLPGPRIIFVNPAFTAMTGYTAAEAIGQSPRILQGPQTDKTVLHRLRQNLQQGEAFEGKAINYRKDGTDFMLEWQIAPLRDDSGTVTHFVAIQRDVTVREQTLKALRESDEKFHQLADNITDAFWIRSPDMLKVHYVSPAFERIWGRPVASLYDHPERWADFIFPADRDRVLATFAGLTGEARSLDIEYRITRPDGEIRWVRVRGFQVRDAGDQLIRHTGIVSDITGQHQAAEELRESERRFRDMLSHLELVSLMLDGEGRITYCNDYLLRLTGWQSSEVMGRNWLELFVPSESVAEVRAVYSALLANRPIAWLHENEIVTRSGIRRLIRWNNSVLRSINGEVIGTASIGEDITDRKRLEAQLFQSQKLETVGKLAGGIAHEFNSILTAIIGQSELLLGDLPAGSPLIKNATEISQAAFRAATLTRQLLAYGRKQIMQPEILDLNHVLTSLEGVLRHLMGPDVDVRILPAATPQPVKVDAGQMEQVIVNIVMNAADAMPRGGRLTLEIAAATFDEQYVSRFPELKAGEYVMLAITDTGAGMREEIKVRVFEPFFTTKGVGRGTGLGLATCYGILKQSGGHIAVYSEPGRGSTFKIYLPQTGPEPKAPVPVQTSAELPRGTETILLVEDDPALRAMAAMLLKRLGYTVLTAADGVEALQLTHQPDIGYIDLLFTDVVMPHMSGKELTDRVRMLFPKTQILFTSAYTESAIVHQGVLNPGLELLQKPFTPSMLARKVREILDKRKA